MGRVEGAPLRCDHCCVVLHTPSYLNPSFKNFTDSPHPCSYTQCTPRQRLNELRRIALLSISSFIPARLL